MCGEKLSHTFDFRSELLLLRDELFLLTGKLFNNLLALLPLQLQSSFKCVIALCELVDEMIRDIQHLELECTSTRYLLSQYMDSEQGSLLRSDILENLGRRYFDSTAYRLYQEFLYNGGDPMEFRDYLVKVQKARNLLSKFTRRMESVISTRNEGTS